MIAGDRRKSLGGEEESTHHHSLGDHMTTSTIAHPPIAIPCPRLVEHEVINEELATTLEKTPETRFAIWAVEGFQLRLSCDLFSSDKFPKAFTKPVQPES